MKMICSASTPILSEKEVSEKLSLLNGWRLGENCIEKEFEFKNFLRAMSFVNAVAYVAESMAHHPDLLVHYNRVSVRNWTHAAGGITEYDFALAARIDELNNTKSEE